MTASVSIAYLHTPHPLLPSWCLSDLSELFLAPPRESHRIPLLTGAGRRLRTPCWQPERKREAERRKAKEIDSSRHPTPPRPKYPNSPLEGSNTIIIMSSHVGGGGGGGGGGIGGEYGESNNL